MATLPFSSDVRTQPRTHVTFTGKRYGLFTGKNTLPTVVAVYVENVTTTSLDIRVTLNFT